jgi:cytochrome c-type biogenesis protein CcmE
MALPTGAKIGIGVVLAGAVGFLLFSDTGEGILEYVDVDKLVDSPADYMGREVKVAGRVVEGSIKQKKGSSADYMFEIEHEGKRLKVHFTDMVPDTFQEGSPVELVGRLNADGDTIESDQMTAKCPSKYEEQLGAKPPQS